MQTQKSNIAVIVIFVVIVTATAGYIGWRFAKQFQGPEQNIQSQSASNRNIQPATPAVSYLEIKEWGIKFPVDPSLAGELTYKLTKVAWDSGEYESANFSSQRLNSVSPGCADGAVSISKIPGTPSNNLTGESEFYENRIENTKQFDKFFLFYQNPQATCSDGKQLDLEREIGEAIRKGIVNATLINQPTTLPVEGILWQAYMNPKNDFGFQYPGGWKIREKYNTLGYADGIVVEVGGPATEETPAFALSVTILPIVYTDVRKAYDEQVAPNLRQDIDHQPAEINFNKYPAISFTDRGIYDTSNIVLAGRNNTLVLSYLSEKQNDPVIQKMLSSFILVLEDMKP